MDILTPEEVDELRPANEPKYLMQNTITTRLVVLIDALAEALRAEHVFRIAVANDAADMDELLSAQRAANATLSRVAAWLEG